VRRSVRFVCIARKKGTEVHLLVSYRDSVDYILIHLTGRDARYPGMLVQKGDGCQPKKPFPPSIPVPSPLTHPLHSITSYSREPDTNRYRHHTHTHSQTYITLPLNLNNPILLLSKSNLLIMPSQSSNVAAASGFAMFSTSPIDNFNNINALTPNHTSSSSSSQKTTKSSKRRSLMMPANAARALFGPGKGYEALDG